jgi:hypothetical protein
MWGSFTPDILDAVSQKWFEIFFHVVSNESGLLILTCCQAIGNAELLIGYLCHEWYKFYKNYTITLLTKPRK